MFQVKFENEEENVYQFLNADSVSDFIYNRTKLWMFASHIRELCNKAKSGDIMEFKDVGLKIVHL